MTEAALVNKISHFLGSQGYSVHHEVPTMGQSVDIVAEKETVLTFIEAKLKDWKRALRQCRNHQIVADYIYIAISSTRISEKLINAANESGFGIIHYNKELDYCYIYLDAIKNENIWQPQRNVLLTKFEKLKSYAHTTLDDIRDIC